MTHKPGTDPTKNGLISFKLSSEQATNIASISGKTVPHVEGYIENGTLVVTNLNIAASEFKHAWNAFADDAWIKPDGN